MAVKLLLRCTKTRVDNIVSKNEDIEEAIIMRASLLNVGLTCCLNVAEGLLQAATKGYYRDIRGLLQCPKSDSNVLDRKGRTPLYLASWKGQDMAVQALLEDHNIDVNIGKTLDGGTAFSIASEKKVDGQLKVMRHLILYDNTVVKSNLANGWCRDNWTPQIVTCMEINDNEISSTTEVTISEAGLLNSRLNLGYV